MTQKLSYERYQWFHGMVSAGKFPNVAKLADHFEISGRQASRDLEFMKERLGAPLRYDSCRRGYTYDKGSYELPPFWLKEEELQALSLALRLAAAIPDREIKKSLHTLMGHFLALRSAAPAPLKLEKLEEKVSIKNVAYYRVPEAIFHAVSAALFGDGALKITYHSPYSNETTERKIRPLHLLCYMGNWHVIAFCGLRKEIRDFAVSRIRAAHPRAETLPLPSGLPPIKEYLRRNFGLLTGDFPTVVKLRFSPAVSPLIAEQEWYEAQEVSIDQGGSLHLSFPVSGLAEVIREILKYGADVEVIEPAELRDAGAKEIRRMEKLYRQK